MDPKKEVSSLELSRELRDLGHPQNDGGWYWEVTWKDGKELVSIEWSRTKPIPIPYKEVIKAPTVRELGEGIPMVVVKGENYYHLEYDRVGGVHILSYERSVCDVGESCLDRRVDTLVKVTADTEANVRAKMRIWLIKNKEVLGKGTHDKFM